MCPLAFVVCHQARGMESPVSKTSSLRGFKQSEFLCPEWHNIQQALPVATQELYSIP